MNDATKKTKKCSGCDKKIYPNPQYPYCAACIREHGRKWAETHQHLKTKESQV